MVNDVAVAKFQAVQDIPPDQLEWLKQFQGAGYSDKAEDGLTPILSILQDNSGEVKKQHERRMEGAEAGMFVIRSLRKLFSGQDGVLVQPFGFFHTFVEWTGDVGEGTPVGRFPSDEPPADMAEFPDPQNPGRKLLRRKGNMNRLVETREHYANLITGTEPPFPIVIPMSGSNHAASRQWTEMMKRTVIGGVKMPSFSRAYRLTTIFRKKGGNQTWFAYQVSPGEQITDWDLLKMGEAACKALESTPVEVNLADHGEEDLLPFDEVKKSTKDAASVI